MLSRQEMDPREDLRPSGKFRIFVSALAAASLLSGCLEDDTGLCCRVLRDDAQGDIPKGTLPMGSGIPTNQIRGNPLFDCDSLTCVSYRASEAFCTSSCDDNHPCSEGFQCEPVVESDSPPCPAENPNCVRFTKDQRFCVRKSCGTAADCPEDYTCTTIYEGKNPPEDPVVKQCVRSDHACSAQ